jgi:hypothetical protein
MKRPKTREEAIEHLVKTDPNFRLLHDRVVERNGGTLPSSEDTVRMLEQRLAQRRASS